MCDTFYVKTKDKAFFGKNSDRSCNEPNLVLHFAPSKHLEPMVQATYVTLPQVKNTNGILLVKPSWIWGGEMGISDKGVCIGNEAVFTKSKGKKTPNLIGMDYLRLALERGNNAEQCVTIITDLLTEYGQGGNCGYDKNFYYDNSYLVADSKEAYIVETAAKQFKVKKLEDKGNISNRLTIQEDDFAKRNSDFLFTKFSGSLKRQNAVAEAIDKVEGLSDAANCLTGHQKHNFDKLFAAGSVGSVCMHQSALGDHTTGSMLYEMGSPVVWLTGCSTPCMSVFKPVNLASPHQPCFTDRRKSLEYWLQREYVLRAVYCGLIDAQDYKQQAKSLENTFMQEYASIQPQALDAWCISCADREQALIDSYASQADLIRSGNYSASCTWKKRNEKLAKGDVFSVFLSKRK